MKSYLGYQFCTMAQGIRAILRFFFGLKHLKGIVFILLTLFFATRLIILYFDFLSSFVFPSLHEVIPEKVILFTLDGRSSPFSLGTQLRSDEQAVESP
ncbi:hypothetical protein RclHR1_06520006 [Rhizophagus clarus]|uniref:Uncharacterized protein n=1 Tax=Rhizophagus clarus TaxID=94130 RepID=A0A2Z6S917_9GLOM|nr:hypothetical protein RclHR1_03170001 [Rhizophagus clarus]GBC05950.1 hypothetical protein RclHR1_06520006 [Rhizophagus clarus]GET00479.1 hypothetical protein RCL_e14275_RclHR1_03170001 [Rhizophagus clarus]